MSVILTDNALTILKKRYFAPGENVEGLWKRVSLGNEKYFKLLSDLRFLPNSPTLFNCGLNNRGTLSACFVFDVADSLLDGHDSILGTRGKAAAVAKAGGGVGYYFGNLRPKGAEVHSVHRKACGPVSVLRDYHHLQSLITQGGKRDLAQMGVLPCYHPDVREFIHAKDEDPKGLESFNISVSWTDEWLSKVDFSKPAAVVLNSGIESVLWWEQCQSAWKTGCPGMLFFDTINRNNVLLPLGTKWIINATNPCGEVPNRSDEPCNLGSINVGHPVYVTKNRTINWDVLLEDVYDATCFLDDILDINVFPHPEIDRAARDTRKLGLGVMGWADLLAVLHIPYDSDEAVQLADTLMGSIAVMTQRASADTAKLKGPYRVYSDKVSGAILVRNETRTSIAPTGTISLIAGCSSGIEPHYAVEWSRVTNEGIRMNERIPVCDRLDGFVPKTTHEISLEWHVKHQAIFQKHTDLGVSKTINLSNSATVADVSKAYELMWKSGCKGGTIYRDGCRSEQVLVSKKSSVYATGSGITAKRKLSEKDDAVRKHKFNVGGCKCYLHVGLFDDGLPGEIFIRASKQGSTVAGMLDSWAMSFSNALQWGTPLADLIRLHSGSRFEPAGLTGNPDLPVCSSIPDYIVRYLGMKYLWETVPEKNSKQSKVGSGQLCSECGVEAIYQSGCLVCLSEGCGWTRCG